MVDEARGRERVYRLELGPLAAVEDFIGRLRLTTANEWERRFMALDTEVHRVKRESKKRAAAARPRDADQPRHRTKEKTG